jgi:hypothetical protein
MPDTLLTIHCATVDTDSIVTAMRTVTRAPIHVRAETVHGRDFGDARSHELVTATLKRSAIECVDDDSAIAGILAAVEAAKRRSPVRWHHTPVTARGRFE